MIVIKALLTYLLTYLLMRVNSIRHHQVVVYKWEIWHRNFFVCMFLCLVLPPILSNRVFPKRFTNFHARTCSVVIQRRTCSPICGYADVHAVIFALEIVIVSPGAAEGIFLAGPRWNIIIPHVKFSLRHRIQAQVQVDICCWSMGMVVDEPTGFKSEKERGWKFEM